VSGGLTGGAVRGGFLTLACIALVAIFTLLQFPWDRFRPWMESQISLATGADVKLGALHLGVSLRGPVADLMSLQMSWPGQPSLVLDMARVGPALSTTWFQGEPALAIDVAIAGGRVDGTVWPLGALAFDGSFDDIDPAALPLPASMRPSPLDGIVSGEADVAQVDGHWVGDLEVSGENGSVALPGMALAIPFDEIALAATLVDDGSIEILEARLDGPMASFDAEGSLGASTRFEQAPLDLRVQLRGVQPALAGPLQSQGIRLDGAGTAQLTVQGTPGRPVIR